MTGSPRTTRPLGMASRRCSHLRTPNCALRWSTRSSRWRRWQGQKDGEAKGRERPHRRHGWARVRRDQVTLYQRHFVVWAAWPSPPGLQRPSAHIAVGACRASAAAPARDTPRSSFAIWSRRAASGAAARGRGGAEWPPPPYAMVVGQARARGEPPRGPAERASRRKPSHAQSAAMHRRAARSPTTRRQRNDGSEAPAIWQKPSAEGPSQRAAELWPPRPFPPR